MENGKQMAFPTKLVNGELHTGLTKREYFAAMAMQGYIATGKGPDVSDWLRCADQLLKELESKSE
jgi:hypothetical protein